VLLNDHDPSALYFRDHEQGCVGPEVNRSYELTLSDLRRSQSRSDRTTLANRELWRASLRMKRQLRESIAHDFFFIFTMI
jgi:hypothetical protein